MIGLVTNCVKSNQIRVFFSVFGFMRFLNVPKVYRLSFLGEGVEPIQPNHENSKWVTHRPCLKENPHIL